MNILKIANKNKIPVLVDQKLMILVNIVTVC